ncbi:4Fe-4S dicluster domain-containing protein [Waddlia chondrophila]|uniref:4Fe-4S dicluster domain-containing protein n=1 Tax=Waddlia chondrophila TaxID=71667 RepID=UPI0005A5553F|nr:4Fe-4S dicluster domain-containing protein [Waddlia chondrophila]
MDRKQFFKELVCMTVDLFERLPVGKVLSQTTDDRLKLRPPGAHPDEQEFLKRCTGCDACMVACPVHAIIIEDLERRDPLLYPKENPCIRCPGTPCITACPTEALHKSFGTALLRQVKNSH